MRMRVRGLIALAILGLGLLAIGRPVAAAERVSIAIGGFGNMAYLPYDVARALGYFTEQDLEVEFQYLKGGSQAATALLSKGVDFSGNSLDHALKASLQGKLLKMIATFAETPAMRLLVRTNYRDTVREIRDLKGHPIGVTGLGSATHLVLTYVLSRGGLAPDEINAVPVGYEALAAALENERVHGIITGGLPAAKLLDAGRAFVLLDLTARGPVEALFGGPYVDTGVMTRPDVITGRPEVCRRLVRAVVRANRWIATHTAKEIADLLPDALVQDRRLYVKALEVARDGFSKDGRVDPRAVETVINAHRAFGAIPADQRVDAASLYDNRFVEQALGGGS